MSQSKKGNILREYVQTKILVKLYSYKESKDIFFVGGTSLRILRGLDRFSEDLDFDFTNLQHNHLIKLIGLIADDLRKENIPVELYYNQTPKRVYFELRFPDVLYSLGLAHQSNQKLVIKLDFDNFWQAIKPQVIFLDRYGLMTNLVTPPLNQILVQKLYTYIHRKQTLARDIYDLVWLLGNKAQIDWQFMKANKIAPNLIRLVMDKYTQDQKHMTTYKKRLRPFLINENQISRLTFLHNYLPFNIQYQGIETLDKTGDRTDYSFDFMINNQRPITVIVSISGTLLNVADWSPTENEIESIFKDKIKDFLSKNTVKNYSFLITTYNVSLHKTAIPQALRTIRLEEITNRA